MDVLIAFFTDIVFDAICEVWFHLMQWIVPMKLKNKAFRRALKILVGVFSIALLLAILAGAVCLASNDVHTRMTGKYIFFGSTLISCIQIVAGIIFRNKNKKNRL